MVATDPGLVVRGALLRRPPLPAPSRACHSPAPAKCRAARGKAMTRLRGAGGALAAMLLIAAFANMGPAQAAVSVARFSVTPSTIQAGAHPRLRVSIAFSEPTGLSALELHLPAGLTAQPRAIPYCPRKSLLADFCPRSSKVGSIEAVAVAYGIELPVTRKIYNVRPRPTERLRLGVSIVASYTGRGVAAEIPVTERPGHRGLDMAVAGLPSEVS